MRKGRKDEQSPAQRQIQEAGRGFESPGTRGAEHEENEKKKEGENLTF